MIALNTDPEFKMAHQRQRMWLMDLPDEILINVMSFLDLETILKAKLVCKQFDDLADQFAYQNLKVLKGRQAVQLASAFNRNPVRVNWVKSLLVSTKFGEDSGLSRLPPHLREMRNLEDLRLETPDCNSRQPDERLDWIRLQDMYESVFVQSSLMNSDASQRRLLHLKYCTIHFVDSNVELYSLTRYASIFLHPTLQSLTMSCASTDTPEQLCAALHNPKDFERSTDLECLFMEECDIHAPSLAYLLKFPRALRSFKLSEGVRYDGLFRTGSRRLHGNVRPHHLMDALTESCSETLESLSLSLGYRRHPTQSVVDPGQYLNMTKMTKLKFVELDNTTVPLIKPRSQCDHKTWLRLPRTLETLKVCNIHLNVHLPFEQTRRDPFIPLDTCIIKEKEKHGVPNLTTIIYSYDFADDEDDYSEIDDLLLLGNAQIPLTGFLGVNNPAPAPVHNTIAGINLGISNNQIHPPQPPAGIPAHLSNNLNLVNPGNHNQAQQFLRQNWFTHANRGRIPTRVQREFTHLEMSKISLLRLLNNNLLSQFRQHNTRLIVDMVKLPRGFIPPYLYPEDKPTTYAGWWDSNEAKETEAYKREIRLAREAKVFERNLRQERDRRRREEELQDLRQRIRRGEDIRYAPLPFLTPEQQAIARRAVGEDEIEETSPNNDDDEDYVPEDGGEDDFGDVEIYDSDDDSELANLPLFEGDIELLNAMDESGHEDEDYDTIHFGQDTGLDGGSNNATMGDENDGNASMNAPGSWPGY